MGPTYEDMADICQHYQEGKTPGSPPGATRDTRDGVVDGDAGTWFSAKLLSSSTTDFNYGEHY